MHYSQDAVMQKVLADHLQFCQRMYVLQTLLPYTAISILSSLVAYSVGQIGHETCQMLMKICLVPEHMLNGMLAYVQYDYRFSLLQNVVKAINHEMSPNAWQMHWHMQILAFVTTFIGLSMLYQLCHIQEFGLLGFHIKRADPNTYLQHLTLPFSSSTLPKEDACKPQRQIHSYPQHRRLRYNHRAKYPTPIEVD